MKDKKFKNKAAWPLLLILGVAGLAIGAIFGGVWVYHNYDRLLLGTLEFFLTIVLSAVDGLFNLFGYVSSWIIDIFIILNPFNEGGAAAFLWEFSKNLAYVILIFLALYSGIQWILNKEDDARRILFGILIIAFLINFTFLLAREIFMVTTFLQNAILLSANLSTDPNQEAKFGKLLYSAFISAGPRTIEKTSREAISQFVMQSRPEGEDKRENLERTGRITVKLTSIVLSVLFSLILAIFAGIVVFKYFIITFLVGVLPLAAIAYATPGYNQYWRNWWNLFLNWNFNLLILIVLVLIGVALIASTTSPFNIDFFKSKLVRDPQWASIMGIEQESQVQDFFSFIMKFIALAAYFVFVIAVGLKLGSVAAKYSYNLALKGWSFVGGLAAGAAMYPARPALSKLGEKIEGWGNTFLGSRFGPLRSLGMMIKNAGSAMQTPLKERVQKEASEIWSMLQDKSPEEIANTFQRYKGDLRKELAKKIGKEMSPEDLVKFASNLDLTKESSGVLSALCKPKLRCTLSLLKEGKAAEALGPLADILDHRKIKLQEIANLLAKSGVEDPNKLMENYLVNFVLPSAENRRAILAHPDNINYINDTLKLPEILTQFGKEIESSPAYRALDELADKIIEVSDVPEGSREQAAKEIARLLKERYKRGKLTKESIEAWLNKINNNELTLADVLGKEGEGSLINLLSQPSPEIEREINEIDNEIKTKSQRAEELKAEIDNQKSELNKIEEKLKNLQKQEYKDPETVVQEETLGSDKIYLEEEKNKNEEELNRIQEEIGRLESQKRALEEKKKQAQPISAINLSNQSNLRDTLKKVSGMFTTPYGPAGKRTERTLTPEILRRILKEEGGGEGKGEGNSSPPSS